MIQEGFQLNNVDACFARMTKSFLRFKSFTKQLAGKAFLNQFRLSRMVDNMLLPTSTVLIRELFHLFVTLIRPFHWEVL